MTDATQNTILQSAKKALIDRNIVSDEKYKPKLIYNNVSAGQIVLSSLQEEMKDCSSFCMSVAFITKGGICSIFNDLQTLEAKGIPGRIITTNYLFFNDPDALRDLRKFKNLEIRMYDGDLHTKGYIFHKEGYDTILIGSSNLTDNALKCNQEWNIRLSSNDQGDLVSEYTNEFERLWSESILLNDTWLEEYEIEYRKKAIERKSTPGYDRQVIKPTAMQRQALEKIREIREQSSFNPSMKRALLISATGTGKTYISAFDVKDANPKKMLFMVHRGKILSDAMDSYKNVLGENGRTYGIYKGSVRDKDVDCLFASVNTLTNHLNEFRRDEFDYIVCDEAHHIVTTGQKRIIDYFTPKFMLGMTATPERTREGNECVYEVFNYNIPYEIRLNKALEENLVCPFHYFGIADLEVDGKERKLSDFSKVEKEERVSHIVKEIERHPYSGNRIRGLIFCSGVEEAIQLEESMSQYYKVKALTGSHSDDDREKYFTQLQADERELDFIISVDILNEGVDLPRVNMVVMLRPTQSAIIFIQQLGRGLRKRSDKDFVTVLDFIGNYDNNYNIPVALFGDNTRRKENLRRQMMMGNKTIPGASTISFDDISWERVVRSINTGHINRLKEMKDAYLTCADKIGHQPSLTELYMEKSLDPRAVVSRYGSLNEFRKKIGSDTYAELDSKQSEMLAQITEIAADGMRPHECVIINSLIEHGIVDVDYLTGQFFKLYGTSVSEESIVSSAMVLNSSLKFVSESLCNVDGNKITASEEFIDFVSNPEIKSMVSDAIECGSLIFDSEYREGCDDDGFVLYKLYSRFAFCRMMNFSKNNVGVINGYKIMGDTCPLFVTYRKVEGKDQMYSDHFIDNKRFFWESRYPRTIASAELQPILKSNENGMKIYLFVQKDGSEGTDYYYCGRVRLIPGTAKNSQSMDPRGKMMPVVSMEFKLDHPVSDEIYQYLIC